MTVYVDSMCAGFGRMKMCHMVANSDDELHAMADAIGVARKWWQSPVKTSGSHYDICLAKKALALAAGAKLITFRQCGAMNSRRRVTGQLGDPETALDWLRKRMAECRQIKPNPMMPDLSIMDCTHVHAIPALT